MKKIRKHLSERVSACTHKTSFSQLIRWQENYQPMELNMGSVKTIKMSYVNKEWAFSCMRNCIATSPSLLQTPLSAERLHHAMPCSGIRFLPLAVELQGVPHLQSCSWSFSQPLCITGNFGSPTEMNLAARSPPQPSHSQTPRFKAAGTKPQQDWAAGVIQHSEFQK